MHTFNQLSAFQGPSAKVKILGKFIERIQEQANIEKIGLMFSLVKKMIEDNVVKARLVIMAPNIIIIILSEL